MSAKTFRVRVVVVRFFIAVIRIRRSAVIMGGRYQLLVDGFKDREGLAPDVRPVDGGEDDDARRAHVLVVLGPVLLRL